MRATKTLLDLQPTKNLARPRQQLIAASRLPRLLTSPYIRHRHRHRLGIKLKPQKYATVWHIVAAATTGRPGRAKRASAGQPANRLTGR